MKFEDRLNELINEAEVPVELLPENIAAMLKNEKARTSKKAEKKNIRCSAAVSAQRRSIIMRTAAATAACAVFAAGMLTYNSRQEEQQQIGDRVVYEAVEPPESPGSYDDLYNIYTDIYLNGDGNIGNTDGYGDDTVIGEGSADGSSGAPGADVPADIYSYGFKDSDGTAVNVSEADIVRCDGNYIYCLKDKTLYVVSLETLSVVSKIECTLDSPIEVYIEGENIILISTETGEKQVINGADDNTAAVSPEAGNSPEGSVFPENDPDITKPAEYDPGGSDQEISADKTGHYIQNENVSRQNTAVDIYNIKDPTTPVHTVSYKQNGSYTASRLVDGKLYTVTAYSDHRVKPLDEQAELDSFVPAYYINEEKFFLDAADITVPKGITSTDYTVVSAINVNGEFSAAVEAVLGSGKNVYCSADTLYIVGTGRNDTDNIAVSAFDLCEDGIQYRAGTMIDGSILSRHSMSCYGENFRIAVRTTDENGASGLAIYVLNRDLEQIRTVKDLSGTENVTSVRFEGNYARLFENGGKVSSAIVDLSADIPVLTDSPIVSTAYLYSYSEDKLLGIGKGENGGIVLTMYDSESGLPLGSITFAEDEKEILSRAFSDKRAVLVEPESSMIGIPLYSHTEFGTKNLYYVFSYDESAGFILKGNIEYTDVDDGLVFERGQLSGDVLYIISNGRIIAARAADLKIMGVYEF